MAQSEQLFFIESQAVDTYTYVIPLEQVISHISNFHDAKADSDKIKRVCYLCKIKNISEYVNIQNVLYSNKQAKLYNASIVPFSSDDEIMEYVKIMQKMSCFQVQNQYTLMSNMIEQQLQIQMIREFCKKQLKWSDAKIDNLIEKQKIKEVTKFLEFRGFNQLQMVIVNGINKFIQNFLMNIE